MWSMTFREFNLAVKGYYARQKSQLRLLAWHAANVMAPHVKKGKSLTPAKLLGERRGFTSKAEAEQYFERAAKPKRRRRKKKVSVDDGD